MSDPTGNERAEHRKLSPQEKRWEWLVWNSPDLAPIEKLALLALFRWHIRYTEVFVSEPTLCGLTGFKDRAMRDALVRLERDGWFRRALLGRGRTGRSYSYTLTFPDWFDRDKDLVLCEWRKRRLIARLNYRIATGGGWENWDDAESLLGELTKLGVDLRELGIPDELL